MAGVQNCIYFILFIGYHGSFVVHGNKCYEHVCFEKGCMDGDWTSDAVQKECENGCMLMKQYSMANVTGKVPESTFWSASCSASAECSSAAALTETSETLIHCCSSDLCNAKLPTVEAGSNQCYAVSCTSDDCVGKAVADNKVLSCPIGQFGCSLTNIKIGNDTQVVASCLKSECKSGYVNLAGIETRTECCNTDLCNQKFTGNPPSGNVCYQIACMGEDCVKNKTASNRTGFCPRSPTDVCSITYMKNVTTGEVTGAAGCLKTDNTPCPSGAVLTDESEIYVQCCDSDLCNTELKQMDTGKKCYSVHCSGSGCLDKAIKDKKTVTCKMDEKHGCTQIRTTTGNVTLEQSMCMPNRCAGSSSKQGDDSIEISCCDENLCTTTSTGANVKYNVSFLALFVISYDVMATLLE